MGHPIPDGHHAITPHLVIKEASEAIDFYKRAFGAEETSGAGEYEDKGVWMSSWVDDVDAIHQHCMEQGLEVTRPPMDEPWCVREMHVRHLDGHVFRISKGIKG